MLHLGNGHICAARRALEHRGSDRGLAGGEMKRRDDGSDVTILESRSGAPRGSPPRGASTSSTAYVLSRSSHARGRRCARCSCRRSLPPTRLRIPPVSRGASASARTGSYRFSPEKLKNSSPVSTARDPEKPGGAHQGDPGLLGAHVKLDRAPEERIPPTGSFRVRRVFTPFERGKGEGPVLTSELDLIAPPLRWLPKVVIAASFLVEDGDGDGVVAASQREERACLRGFADCRSDDHVVVDLDGHVVVGVGDHGLQTNRLLEEEW